MGDPERYRKQDEVHRWQENDPIGIYQGYLVKEKIATDKELSKVESDAMQEVEEAADFAEKSPEPAAEELFTDIYVEGSGG